MLFDCCIALGFEAEDTRSNATEVARWVARRNYKTVRLVTTDWPMRRAEYEIGRSLGQGVPIGPDAVRSEHRFSTPDRKRVTSGKKVSRRVDSGGSRNIKK